METSDARKARMERESTTPSAPDLHAALRALAAEWKSEVTRARCYGSKTIVNLDAEAAAARLTALLDAHPVTEREAVEDFRIGQLRTLLTEYDKPPGRMLKTLLAEVAAILGPEAEECPHPWHRGGKEWCPVHVGPPAPAPREAVEREALVVDLLRRHEFQTRADGTPMCRCDGVHYWPGQTTVSRQAHRAHVAAVVLAALAAPSDGAEREALAKAWDEGARVGYEGANERWNTTYVRNPYRTPAPQEGGNETTQLPAPLTNPDLFSDHEIARMRDALDGAE